MYQNSISAGAPPQTRLRVYSFKQWFEYITADPVPAHQHTCQMLWESIQSPAVQGCPTGPHKWLKYDLLWPSISFLADRTKGRAIGTVLRLSVCRLSYVPWSMMAKRCVLEQKLLLRAYRKSYMRNRFVPNEWPWPLFRGRIEVTSTVALHFTSNTSVTVRDRGLVPKEHQ